MYSNISTATTSPPRQLISFLKCWNCVFLAGEKNHYQRLVPARDAGGGARMSHGTMLDPDIGTPRNLAGSVTATTPPKLPPPVLANTGAPPPVLANTGAPPPVLANTGARLSAGSGQHWRHLRRYWPALVGGDACRDGREMWCFQRRKPKRHARPASPGPPNAFDVRTHHLSHNRLTAKLHPSSDPYRNRFGPLESLRPAAR